MTKNTEIEQSEVTEVAESKSYKKELIIGAAVVVGSLAVIGVIALAIYSSIPKVVYQPATACALFTQAEAQELLGDSTFNTNSDAPVISKNFGSSKCGYADGNPDKEKVVVAAINIRSGINDNGVQQNKSDFTNGMPTQGVEEVKDLGDKAYFNFSVGQLNVLNGRDWIIFSYGVGSTPQENTVENAVMLAKKVVR